MRLKQILRQKVRDLYRHKNEFKRGYQPRSNLAKDESGDMLVESHKIKNRQKNYCQLLNVHYVNDVRQTEMHTAKLLVPEPSSFKVQIAIEKDEIYKSPDTHEILAELIQAGGNTHILHCDVHKHINSIYNKEEVSHLLLYLLIERAIKLAVVIIGYHCYQLQIQFYPIFLS